MKKNKSVTYVHDDVKALGKRLGWNSGDLIEYDEILWSLAEFMHRRGYGFAGTSQIVKKKNDKSICLAYLACPYPRNLFHRKTSRQMDCTKK